MTDEQIYDELLSLKANHELSLQRVETLLRAVKPAKKQKGNPELRRKLLAQSSIRQQQKTTT